MHPRTVCRCCIDYFPTYFLCLLVAFWTLTYIMMYCVWHLMYFREHLAMPATFIAIYLLFVLMFLWSYFETMCQDPSEVPDQYRFNDEDSARVESLDVERMNMTLQTVVALRGLTILTRLSNSKMRYCRFCHLLKPDRAHHCPTCNSCSMKMDHHCPWISSCIAFYNYKQFILLQFYGFMLTAWIVATISPYIAELFNEFFDHIMIAITFITAILSMIFFLVLLIYHTMLLSKNETTLESKYHVTFINYQLTFSLGCCCSCLNCREVCGDNCCCWLCPVFTSKGNGHEFPVLGPNVT